MRLKYIPKLIREALKGYRQKWKKISYPEVGFKTPARIYRSWSPKVFAEGDESLDEESPQHIWQEWRVVHWTKVVVLNPTVQDEEKEDVEFTVGFTNKFGDTEIATGISRRVNEALFAMRMGPDDCHYFIVSKEEGVELGLEIDHYTIEDELNEHITLY